MDWRNTEVEVDLPNGACYQASIKDITESGILVVFKDDLKPETSVRFEKVRLLPHQDEDSFDFKQGDIIQVYSKADEDHIKGWWKAKIQFLKGDNYYIEYVNRGGMDLQKKDNIRPINQGDCFRKLLVKVPKNLKAICEEAGIHTEFIKHSGVLAVIYSRASSSLIFVSTSEYLNKKAELLADLHVKALKEKLQQRQYREKNKHTETFMVTSDLMGLAIGTKGANIKEAERMKGIGSVTKVERDDGYLFKISGESPEAVIKARALLEFKKEQLTVPRQFAGRLIGKAGKTIDEIKNKSMVNKIIRRNKSDGVIFKIIGNPESIETAKAMINIKLDAFKNIYSSKEDAERNEELSDNENSSDFIGSEQSEQMYSDKHTPNRAEIKDNGGRFQGGQRIRNNCQQAESTENLTTSNIIHQKVRTTENNDRSISDSETQELLADSENLSDDTHSCVATKSAVYRQPNKGKGNGDRYTARKKGSGGGGIRHTGKQKDGDNVSDEDRSPHFADTETRSEDLSFPKCIEDPTNRKHQGKIGKIQGYEEDDERMQLNDGSLSQSSGKSISKSRKTNVERIRRYSNSSVRRSDDRERKGSRITGGWGKVHHQQKHQFPDGSDENINSDVEIKEIEYSNSSSGFDEKFSTIEDVTKSLGKCNTLLEDTPKVKIQTDKSKEMKEKKLMEEELDKINEMEVLEFLVQVCQGGCSFETFCCVAYELFYPCIRIEEWFNKRSKRFHLYRDGRKIVYIGSYYKDLNICKHFFNPSKPTFCENDNCNAFHVCRNFVRGNCRRQNCSFPHDLASPQNVKIKEKYGLENFADSDIIVLLNWKLPRLCHHYIYEHGGCKETENKHEACPYLHYCKSYFFGKCDRGDNCRYNHSLSDSHNKWVLTSCHLANHKEDNLKRMIYVPPNLENLKEQANTESKVDDFSRQETFRYTTNQCQTDQRGGFKHLSTSEFKFIGKQAALQEKMGVKLSMVRYSDSVVTEDTPESDDSLLAEAAGKKHICLALTKKDCPSSVCSDLHLQNGVPYLWQVKMEAEWVSFLPKDNFKIENAYCSLEQNVQIKDIVYSGNICTVDISFEIIDEHMYGNVCDDTASATNRVDVRRLSTPSFGERYLSVDSYLTQWRWYWKNDHDVWLLFDTDLQIYTLEVKYMNQQRTYLFSRENYEQKYRLSFSSMKQVNIEYGTTREIMRRPLFVSKEDIQKKNHPKKIVSTAIDGEKSKPAHFYPWDLANEFELVEIPFSFTSEYNDVLSSFHETMSEEKYEVRSILRVQSKKLWSEFEIKKKQLYADAEKYNPTFSAIDERSLFHGTNSLDVCRGICINNFDFRKSGKNATAFGEGSYFARDARYSHQYTEASFDFGDRYMFRAKVLVGKFTTGEPEYRRPPEIPGQSHKLYDSCVNNPINPNIFVIFDRSQSYPEYLINYREKDYDQRRISSRTTHSSVPSYPLTGGTSQQPIHQRMPTKIAAYTSRGTSLGIAQKPGQPSMQPTSSTAYPSGGTSLGVARKPVQSSTHSIPSYLRTSLGISQRPVQSSMHSTRSTAYSSGGTNLGVPRKQVQTNMHSLSSTGHSSVGNSLGVSRKPVQSSIHSASSTGHSSGSTSSGFARTPVQSSTDSARSTANSSGEISSGTAAKYNPVLNSSSSMMNSSSSSSSTSFQPFDHSNVSSGSSQPSSSQNSISTNTNQDRDCVIL